jgi:hypothetical protein
MPYLMHSSARTKMLMTCKNMHPMSCTKFVFLSYVLKNNSLSIHLALQTQNSNHWDEHSTLSSHLIWGANLYGKWSPNVTSIGTKYGMSLRKSWYPMKRGVHSDTILMTCKSMNYMNCEKCWFLRYVSKNYCFTIHSAFCKDLEVFHWKEPSTLSHHSIWDANLSWNMIQWHFHQINDHLLRKKPSLQIHMTFRPCK